MKTEMLYYGLTCFAIGMVATVLILSILVR
jgi:hypothetical protein